MSEVSDAMELLSLALNMPAHLDKEMYVLLMSPEQLAQFKAANAKVIKEP